MKPQWQMRSLAYSVFGTTGNKKNGQQRDRQWANDLDRKRE